MSLHFCFFIGLVISLILAECGYLFSKFFGGPAILYALLCGLGVSIFFSNFQRNAGVKFAASNILKIGIALIGFQISISELLSMGWKIPIVICLLISSSIAFGFYIAPKLKLSPHMGLLTGGAVAICGASAALAISSSLPKSAVSDQQTSLVIILVTALSTLAMVLYPILAVIFSLSDQSAGFLLGATIHDLAQVVGAGYLVSDDAGKFAVLTKLLRVSLLVPTIIILRKISHGTAKDDDTNRPALLPLFLILFLAFFLLANLGIVPRQLIDLSGDISKACLLISVAAIGLKTQLSGLIKGGISALVITTAETFILLSLALLALFALQL
jgi:uncharacterized integral membrane protein (TIGR00698 family)